jgi:hypothetical protein
MWGLVRSYVTLAIQEFHAFYGIKRFITMFIKDSLDPILGQSNSMHTHTFVLANIHFNIALLSALNTELEETKITGPHF